MRPFKGLIVTDLMFPGGEKAPAMRRWLRSQGATVPLESVSVYDYLYDMNRAGVFVDRVDLTITFGFCYSSYNSLATDMVDTDADKSPYNSSNKRQYRWLPKQNHLHHLNESLFGQNAAATNIILGPAYQIDAIKQTCKSFPATVVRLHIPHNRNGQPILGIRMGRGCKFSQGHVLMAHVSGPNTDVVNSHMVRTSSGEVQLDLCSLIMSTLRANGTVVSLASGECRLFELLKAPRVPKGLGALLTSAQSAQKTERDNTFKAKMEAKEAPGDLARRSKGDCGDDLATQVYESRRRNECMNDMLRADGTRAD